jgi:hypothetical protein
MLNPSKIIRNQIFIFCKLGCFINEYFSIESSRNELAYEEILRFLAPRHISEKQGNYLRPWANVFFNVIFILSANLECSTIPLLACPSTVVLLVC